MKGNFMPKLNNKGFGIIPILIISLLIGVFGIFTFNYLSSNGVLSKSENRDLAQVNIPDYTSPNKTVPSGAMIEATLSYNETSGYQTGYIRLNLKGISNNINALRYDLNKYGLEVQDYCMTQVCPKPRIVKPRVNLVSLNPVEAEIEVPVTPMVKSIAYKSYPQRNRYDMPEFVFRNKLDNWTIKLNDESRTFSLVRNNESTNIGVYIKSGNSTTGQTNLEFLINGIGDNSANFIRSIRVEGVRRMDRIGSTYRTTIVRPNVVYRNGQGVMNITALSNTSTIYFGLGDLKVQFLPVPSGWRVNPKGDGLDRDFQTENPSVVDITLISMANKSQTYEVRVSGNAALKQINEIISSKGINRVDGTSYNNSKTTTFYPIPRMYNGYFTFTVTALPNTLSFYVNSPHRDIKAVPGKIPAGWKINQNSDGLDRIGNR